MGEARVSAVDYVGAVTIENDSKGRSHSHPPGAPGVYRYADGGRAP